MVDRRKTKIVNQLKKKKKAKDCDNYLDGFCLMHIGDARVWDCTANNNERLMISKKGTPNMFSECPYPSGKKRAEEMRNATD